MSLLNKASLIQIPSGYKDGTLYSAKPTNGDGDFTFSRGSNLAATRINSEGLIEKGRENLLLQSNSFNTTWSNVLSGSITSGQSGYDGTDNAWKLSKGATAYRYIIQSLSVSGVYAFSLYAKADTLNQVTIFNDTGGSSPYAKFSLVDGSVVASSGLIDSSATDVGNGWWRLSATFNTTITTARIYPDFAETTSGSIYIQDAQLEQGLVATDYIETTTTTAQAGILEDMPRLDYSGGATCGHLLLEPQRSNVITQSEYFGAWSKSYAGTGSLPIITVNEAISPEGLQNASKIVLDKGSGQTSGDYAFIQLGTTMTGDATYSIYLKSATSSSYEVALRIVNTITTVTVNSEWQRFDVSATSTTNPTAGIWLRGGYSTSDNAEFYAFAAQVEAGSYPTSYIPTYGASVTRGADSLSISGMSNNLASGVSSATLFMDFEFQKEVTADTLTFRSSTSPLGRGYLYDVGMGMADSYGINITLTENTQQKCIWRLNTLSNATVFANGTKGNTSNGNTWSDVDTIDLFGSRWSMKIKQITLFNSALTDDECIQLTTL